MGACGRRAGPWALLAALLLISSCSPSSGGMVPLALGRKARVPQSSPAAGAGAGASPAPDAAADALAAMAQGRPQRMLVVFKTDQADAAAAAADSSSAAAPADASYSTTSGGGALTAASVPLLSPDPDAAAAAPAAGAADGSSLAAAAAAAAQPDSDEARAARVRAHAEVKARVLFGDTSGSSEIEAAAVRGYEVVQDFEQLPVSLVAINSTADYARLTSDPSVLAVVPDRRNKVQLGQSLPLIHQPEAAALGARGAGCAVAVLDTGADYTHPELGSCARPGAPEPCRVAYARDFTTYDDGQLDAPERHGTNVASVVARVAPGAKILALDVFDGDGAYDSDILRALNWVIQNRVGAAYGRVCAVNLSLGGSVHYSSPCAGDMYQSAFSEARSAGILVAVAAGNEKQVSALAAPACAPAAVSVGAVYDSAFGAAMWGGDGACQDDATAADEVACFSNSAYYLTMLAPGAMTTAGGVSLGGTSQATPHVAGAIAVLAAAAPGATPDEIVSALQSGGKAVRDPRNGITRPRLDLPASVKLIAPDAGVDTDPPAGAVVKINGGAGYANSRDVTLAITATDASAITQACVTNSPLNFCSTFIGYAEAMPWTLAAGADGHRSVYVRLRDARGNTMVFPAWASIVLDTTPPAGASIVIANGAPATASRSPPLALGGAESGGGALQMCVANTNDDSAPCSSYIPFSASLPAWGLLDGPDGTRTVYLTLQDAAGNQAKAQASILLDTSPPTAAVVVAGAPAAAGGAPPPAGFTGARDVNVTIAAADASRVTAMCIRDAAPGAPPPSACASGFRPFAPSSPLTLADGADGERFVYVWLTDELGNQMASPAVATVTLDTQPPAGAAIRINGGAATAASRDVTLQISGSDPSGVASMCIAEAGAPNTAAGAACPAAGIEPFAASKAWRLADGPDGARTLRVWLADGLGHVTPAPAEATITLDTMPRGASGAAVVTLAGGAAAVGSRSLRVVVDVTAPPAGAAAGGALEACINDRAATAADCKAADWRPLASTMTVAIRPKGDGPRTLRVFLRSAGGAAAGAAAGGAASGAGAAAGEATFVFDATPPALSPKTVGFTAAAGGAARDAVTLTFNGSAAEDPVSGVVSYSLVALKGATPPPRCALSSTGAGRPAFAGTYAPGGGVRTVRVGGLEAGAKYKFRLCAADAAGNVAPGLVVAAATLP